MTCRRPRSQTSAAWWKDSGHQLLTTEAYCPPFSFTLNLVQAAPRQTLRSRLLRSGTVSAPVRTGLRAMQPQQATYSRWQAPGAPDSVPDESGQRGFSDAGPAFSWDHERPQPQVAPSNGHSTNGADHHPVEHGQNGHHPNGNGHNGHRSGIPIEDVVHAGQSSESSIWFRRNEGKE